jgi:hypothetical protein
MKYSPRERSPQQMNDNYEKPGSIYQPRSKSRREFLLGMGLSAAALPFLANCLLWQRLQPRASASSG